MAAPDDMDKFLNSVDEIAAAVKDLAKPGADTVEVVKNADQLLKKFNHDDDDKLVPLNKTVINQAAFDNWQSGPPPTAPNAESIPSVQEQGGGESSQAAFMAALEQDAKERGERRRKNDAEANRLKEKGNEVYQKGNYSEAADYYSQALSVFKLNTKLWTNRAQCYMHLGRHDEAIEDCEWALRVSEDCTKAYYLKGKNLMAQDKLDQAIECYKCGMELASNKDVIAKCLQDAERAQKVLIEEGEVVAKMKKEKWKVMNFDEIIPRLLAAVSTEPEVYIGGLRTLKNILASNTERVLFRVRGGLDLLHHPVLVGLARNISNKLNEGEVNLLKSFLEMAYAAVDECEENQCRALDDASFCEVIILILEAPNREIRAVQMCTILLLNSLLNFTSTKEKLVKTLDLSKILTTLLKTVGLLNAFSTSALKVLSMLCTTEMFRQHLLTERAFKEFFGYILALLRDNDMHHQIMWRCLDHLTQILSNPSITKKMLESDEVLVECHIMMEKFLTTIDKPESESTMGMILAMLLQMLIHMSPENRVAKAGVLFKLNGASWGVFKNVNVKQQFRATALHFISTSIAVTPGLIEELASQGVVNMIHDQGLEVDRSAAVKLLAMCTHNSEKCCKDFCNLPDCLEFLGCNIKSTNDGISGNSALIISQCLNVVGGTEKATLAARLTSSNIMESLLLIARDGARFTAKHNASITIAKLCHADTRHLDMLRKMNGVEILHEVIKKEPGAGVSGVIPVEGMSGQQAEQ